MRETEMIVELVEAVAILAAMVGAVLVVLSIAVALGRVAASPRSPVPAALQPAPAVRPRVVREAPAPPLPPNTVDVDGRRYLRVTSGCGAILHLTPRADEAASCRGRSALGAHPSGGDAGMRGYDDALMRLPVWNVRTMCGLRWTAMAGHDAELAALIARAGGATGPGAGCAYVCPVCAARVAPGHHATR